MSCQFLVCDAGAPDELRTIAHALPFLADPLLTITFANPPKPGIPSATCRDVS